MKNLTEMTLTELEAELVLAKKEEEGIKRIEAFAGGLDHPGYLKVKRVMDIEEQIAYHNWEKRIAELNINADYTIERSFVGSCNDAAFPEFG